MSGVEIGQHLAREELVHCACATLSARTPVSGRGGPRSHSAARYSAAGQPSVRAVSVATRIGVELDAVDGGEHRPRLLRRERERRRPDLGEPALGAQPRDPQARNGAGDQHEADVLAGARRSPRRATADSARR